MSVAEIKVETKTRLLDAAERLFSEHGFAATSLRAITAAADANLAAVNYHFGSKERIVRAVFDRRLGPLNAERLRLLDACERDAAPDAPDLERVLRAMTVPWAREVRESSRSGIPFVRLLGRAHFEPDPALRQLIVESFGEVSRRFIAAFGRCRPQLHRAELSSRFYFAVGALTVIADLPMFSSFGADEGAPPADSSADLEPVVEHMIAFLRAGFEAAPSDSAAGGGGGA